MSFIDTMLQFTILESPIRELYLPTRLLKIIIDPIKHLQMVNSGLDALPVENYKNIKIVKAGGVELRGIKTSLAPRRQNLQDAPKLEKYVFTPYKNLKETSKFDALTSSLAIVVENASVFKMKIVEVVIDRPVEALLSPIAMEILESEPMLRTDISVATSQPPALFTATLEPLSIKAANKDVRTVVPEQNCHLAIGVDVLSRHGAAVLKNMNDSLLPGGMILLEEVHGFLNSNPNLKPLQDLDLDIISFQLSQNNTYLVVRKNTQVPTTNTITIKITEKDFTWVEEVKEALKASEANNTKIYLTCEEEVTAGVVGMVNCLKQESGGNNVRLYFMQDKAEKFSLTSNFYKAQLKRDLLMNVFKDGVWGSYKHLKLDHAADVATLQVIMRSFLFFYVILRKSSNCLERESVKLPSPFGVCCED